MAACGGTKAPRPDSRGSSWPEPPPRAAPSAAPQTAPQGYPSSPHPPSGTGSWTPCLPTPAPQVLQEKGFTSKTWFVFRLRARVSSGSPAPATSPPWAYCLLPPSDSGPGVRASPRGVVPSKRWEAMAAWCDMLFRTMSPFRHSTTSCRVAGTAREKGLGSLRGWAAHGEGHMRGGLGRVPGTLRQRPPWSPANEQLSIPWGLAAPADHGAGRAEQPQGLGLRRPALVSTGTLSHPPRGSG